MVLLAHDFCIVTWFSLVFVSQPHKSLLCVTNASSGVLNITTGAGFATALYDISVLVQPPVISSVSPLVWSTITNTVIIIQGER